MLLVEAFLDVDGGGVDSLGGADVFGWYGEGAAPVGVSSAAPQSGLDFALPRAEIHGSITFLPGQIEARVDVSADLACLREGFRPGHFAYGSGPYAIIGVYPGSYCVSASGYSPSGPLRICYGDPTCAHPAAITLAATEVRVDVDLDVVVVHEEVGVKPERESPRDFREDIEKGFPVAVVEEDVLAPVTAGGDVV